METGKAILVIGGIGIGAYLLYRAFGQGLLNPALTGPYPPPNTQVGGGSFSPNGELLKGTSTVGDRNPQFRITPSNPVGLAVQVSVGSAAYLVTHPTEAKGVGQQIIWPVTTIASGVSHVATDVVNKIGSIF